jgi:hypothetical protein
MLGGMGLVPSQVGVVVVPTGPAAVMRSSARRGSPASFRRRPCGSAGPRRPRSQSCPRRRPRKRVGHLRGHLWMRRGAVEDGGRRGARRRPSPLPGAATVPPDLGTLWIAARATAGGEQDQISPQPTGASPSFSSGQRSPSPQRVVGSRRSARLSWPPYRRRLTSLLSKEGLHGCPKITMPRFISVSMAPGKLFYCNALWQFAHDF